MWYGYNPSQIFADITNLVLQMGRIRTNFRTNARFERIKAVLALTNQDFESKNAVDLFGLLLYESVPHIFAGLHQTYL